MIYAQPGAPFQVVADGFEAGLVGTVGVQLLDNATGTVVLARTTGGITEPIKAPKPLYLFMGGAAPAEGRYTVVWDDGTTSASDDLIVGGPAPFGPSAGGSGTLVDDLVAQVVEQGNFDAPPAWVLGWLDQRHKLMCSRSKCFRKKVTLATVAGQSAYPVPAEVQEILEVTVASPIAGGLGVPYAPSKPEDLSAGALGFVWLSGVFVARGGGIFVRDESSEGVDEIALYPTPTESGLSVVVSTVCRPGGLELGTAVRTPPEFDDGLVAGAIATGLERIEARPDIASSAEQKFGIACEELVRQVRRRFKGQGPSKIRVRR